EPEIRLGWIALHLESEPSEALVLREKGAARLPRESGLLPVAFAGATPRPRVAKPERRQKMERRSVRSAIRGGDPDQEIVRRGLCVLDEDVEVPVLVEDAGVGELELSFEPSAAAVFLHQA